MNTLRGAPSLMVLVVAVTFVSFTAQASELPKGTFEVSPGLTFERHSYSREYISFVGVAYTEKFDLTRFVASADLGYCVTNRFEILGGLLVDHNSMNWYSATRGGLSAGVQVNFATSSGIVPFVRVGAGVLAYSGEGSTSVLGPIVGAGFRGLVHSAASVNIGLEYQHETNSLGVEGASGNGFGLKLGLSIFPGSSIPTGGTR